MNFSTGISLLSRQLKGNHCILSIYAMLYMNMCSTLFVLSVKFYCCVVCLFYRPGFNVFCWIVPATGRDLEVALYGNLLCYVILESN